jgi:glutaryl-CoA dehydrogenase
MGDIGLLGPTIQSHDCLGVDQLTYGLMAKNIEYIDSGYRSAFSVQSSLVMNPISKFGSDYLKNKYLPELRSGNMVGCFCLTEPNHGSDIGSLSSIAHEESDHYRLTGSKTWITNAPVADLFIIWAKDNKTKRLKGFVVERDTEGLDTQEIDGKFSLRASITGSVYFDNIKVPKKNLLHVDGFTGPFNCLNSARFGIAFGSLGSAEKCIESAIDYTLTRKQFGKELASNQLVQKSISDAVSEYNIALSSCYSFAEDYSNLDPSVISLIKKNSCEKSLEISRKMRDLLGGNGISDEYDIIRHVMNLEAVNTYEGTNSIHSLILGKYVTGLSAF